MATEELHKVFVRTRSETDGEWFVHQDLRERLVDDAREKSTNLTSVVVQILADHFNVPLTVSTRTTAPSGDYDKLIQLRIPSSLLTPIDFAAAQAHHTRAQEIRVVLCAHYGLTIPERPKKTRNRRPRPRLAA